MAPRPLTDRPGVRFGLAALLGAAGVLCFAPFELFWLAPLVWGGFFALLRRAADTRAAMLVGLAFGLGFFLCGVSWVYVSLSVFGGMPWWLAGPAAFLFCAVMALFPMFAGGTFKHWQPAAFWPPGAPLRRSRCRSRLAAWLDFHRLSLAGPGLLAVPAQPAGRLRPPSRRARPVAARRPSRRPAAALAHRHRLRRRARHRRFRPAPGRLDPADGEAISVALIQGTCRRR